MVSIQQAAAGALAAYLERSLPPDCAVEQEWPDPKRRFENKTVTVLLAGPRDDDPIDIKYLGGIPIGATLTYGTYQVKMCSQDLQLDVWTTSNEDRDDLIARLDDLLNAGETALLGAYNPEPVGSGLLLRLGDGWEETIADYKFESTGSEDTPDSVNTAEFRATIRGTVFLMLTVSRVTARQTVIDFVLRVRQSGAPETFDPSGLGDPSDSADPAELTLETKATP